MKNRNNTTLVSIKTNKEIVEVLKKSKKFNLPFITIWVGKTTNKSLIEYALLVNKSQFKEAVTRNKVKRQIRNILSNSNFKGGLKILFKPNSLYLKKKYQEIELQINKLLEKHQNGK